MKLKQFLILLFFLLLLKFSYAEQSSGLLTIDNCNDVYKLSNKWFFINEDNLTFKEKDIDLKNWPMFPANNSWAHAPGFEAYKGTSWCRMTIEIQCPSSDFSMFVPLHYRGAQFYINGELVHETRHFTSDGSNPVNIGKPDVIDLAGKLNTGANTIAIRTGWLDHNGGFMETMKIGPHDKIQREWAWYILWNGALFSILTFWGLYFLLLFFKRRNEQLHLFYSGLSLSLGF